MGEAVGAAGIYDVIAMMLRNGRKDFMSTEPTTVYSHSEDADRYVITWKDVEGELELSQMYWITSLEDGIPHTVPVIGIWYEGALYSCNPRSEQKYTNLTTNPTCQALIGSSQLNKGLDVAVHGTAEEMPDMEDRLRFGKQMAEKYSLPWRFQGTEEDMWVYRIVPTHIRAFHRSNPLASARFDCDQAGAE